MSKFLFTATFSTNASLIFSYFPFKNVSFFSLLVDAFLVYITTTGETGVLIIHRGIANLLKKKLEPNFFVNEKTFGRLVTNLMFISSSEWERINGLDYPTWTTYRYSLSWLLRLLLDITMTQRSVVSVALCIVGILSVSMQIFDRKISS